MTAHKILAHVTFGWLIAGGVIHFLIDVVSFYWRGMRAPGAATTLFYGLHSTYSLGQILFGLMGLLIVRQALPLLGTWPALSLCAIAAAGWFAIILIFSEYKQPLFWVIGFALLLAGTAVTAKT
ncbi:hypothetical protein C1T17_02775 [Sphingobium sp. SCG-1]|uniref:hypothetical protein n=1 Tax=Sphingobium sp. SCG-1 TaxID=2072936 RepID=UPI000CD6B1F2|nr:hypothetical protein [Sphingobium sp. SCG-1]AUW57170.1 hypothetical protein C1T17_02775 [Sphingobium sp. SCG-1]